MRICMSIKEKLNALCKIAQTFNREKITWNLGSSGMLFLRGIVHQFNDLDLMIAIEDIEKAAIILDAFGDRLPPRSTQKYQTKHFIEYVIDGVDVDLMAEFVILKDQQSYTFEIHKGDVFDWMMLGFETIYLASIKEWKYYYHLMERHDKISILESISDYHSIELYLKKPSQDDIPNIDQFKQAFVVRDESLHGSCGITGFDDLHDWLNYLELLNHKETVPAGRVLSSEYLCIRKSDDKMVGIVNIRHELDDELLKHGGHIGYSIHPDERQKGYAKEQLRLALLECQRIGINPILITCNQHNEASRKTILHAKGVLENTFVEEDGNIVERYWVTMNT